MIAGLLGATVTVAATTADDAVWLVPYVASATLPPLTRIIHALLFATTLESLAVACAVAALLIQRAVLLPAAGGAVREDVVMGIAGAALCWAVAIFLYVRRVMKRRRRAAAAAVAAAAKVDTSATDYGAIETADDASSSSSDDGSDAGGEVPRDPSPWTVITLTTLGALDEVSYFPALLVGGVFTPFQLCLGTFLAACIILAVVVLFLARCTPLLDCLDRLPLYLIVGLFATALTFGVIVDVVSSDGDDGNDQ